MKQTLVRYKLRPDQVEQNEALIAAVFEQLRRDNPPGLHYASFKLDDGVSFVHIVSHDSPDGASPLQALPAFKAFIAGIRDRCAEAPVSSQMTEVGNHGVFGK